MDQVSLQTPLIVSSTDQLIARCDHLKLMSRSEHTGTQEEEEVIEVQVEMLVVLVE